MEFQLWSRDHLIGETDLGFIYRPKGFRCGWFHPNSTGEPLMSAATGVGPAMRAAYEAGHDVLTDPGLLAAIDRQQALVLQLRRSDGVVIQTEDVAIIDTHYLLSIGRDDVRDECLALPSLTPEEEAELEAETQRWLDIVEAKRPWEHGKDEEASLPRYQVQVRFRGATL